MAGGGLGRGPPLWEQVAEGDEVGRVAQKHEGIARAELKKEFATGTTGREERAVRAEGQEVGGTVFPRGEHGGEGGTLRAETEPAGGVEAEPHMDVAGGGAEGGGHGTDLDMPPDGAGSPGGTSGLEEAPPDGIFFNSVDALHHRPLLAVACWASTLERVWC